LHQAVRAAPGGAGHARRALVEIDAAADEVDRRARSVPDVRDGITLAFDFDRFGDDETPVPQFLKERQQPALARDRRAGVAVGQFRRR
jgi:hypothetical protein